MNYQKQIENFEFELNDLMNTLDEIIVIFDNEGEFRKEIISDTTLELDE